MAGVFKLAEIRNEAETYHAQGLHQEALAVYDRFLTKSEEIHPALKISIKESIRRIRSFARENDHQENSLLSDIEITLIKKGWFSRATVDDCMTSARTLMKLGRYQDALNEYRQLLSQKHLTAATINGVARCLVHLNPPERFVYAVDAFARSLFKLDRNRLTFMLLIARKIESNRHPIHFSILHNHIAEVKSFR